MNVTAINNLRAKKFHLGTWLSLGSPQIAELAGLCGFDWLLIDLEHGAVGESALFAALQALRGSQSAVIVRVGAAYSDLIQRVLDWGADGIMVPHVDDAKTARDIVRMVRFAPHGVRGYSRSVRACDYGLSTPDQNVRPVVIAQIESEIAVKNSSAIAGVEGVDVLFVGPSDLKFDLNAVSSNLSFDYCITTVADAAKSNGLAAGILCRQDNDVDSLKEKGYSFTAIDSDSAILRKRYIELVNKFADK